MNEKIKRILPYITSGGLSILTFLYLIFNYVKYDIGLITTYASGYDCMNLFNTNIAGILLSIFLIILLVLNVALLVFAVLGILKEYKVISFEIKNNLKYNEWGVLVHAILSGLIMIFTIAYVASNIINKIAIGSFIGLIVSVGTYVLYRYVVVKKPIALPLTNKAEVLKEEEEEEEEESKEEEKVEEKPEELTTTPTTPQDVESPIVSNETNKATNLDEPQDDDNGSNIE